MVTATILVAGLVGFGIVVTVITALIERNHEEAGR